MFENVLIIVLFAVLVIAGIIIAISVGSRFIISPEKQAGKYGERVATNLIKEVLYEDEVLLNNVHVSAEGMQTELDNLIINKYGIFIIEVKNYSGELHGEEDDKEWLKIKITPGGNTYSKIVKNPIGQVKRQEYILSRYLKQHGIREWVKGYVFFIEMNSPVRSGYVLDTRRDIDRAIHTPSVDGAYIDDQTKARIEYALRM